MSVTVTLHLLRAVKAVPACSSTCLLVGLITVMNARLLEVPCDTSAIDMLYNLTAIHMHYCHHLVFTCTYSL